MNFLPIYFNLKPRNNIQKCPWELNETFHFIWKKKIMECHFGGYNLLSYFLTFRSCYVYISVPVHPFSKKLVLRSVPVLCIFKYFRIRSVFRTPLSNFRPYPYIFRTRTHGYGYGKSTDPYPPFGVWGEHFVVSTFPKALSNFFLHAPSPIPKVCHKTPVLQSKEPSLSSLFSGFLAKYAKYQNLLYYSEFYEDTAKIWFYHMKPDYFNQFL